MRGQRVVGWASRGSQPFEYRGPSSGGKRKSEFKGPEVGVCLHVAQQEGRCVGAESPQGSTGGRRLDEVRGTAAEESMGKCYY